MLFSKSKNKTESSPREDAKAGMFSEKVEADSIKRWRSFAGDSAADDSGEELSESPDDKAANMTSTVMLTEEDAILPQATARWRTSGEEMALLTTPEVPQEEKVVEMPMAHPQPMPQRTQSSEKSAVVENSSASARPQTNEKARSAQNLVSDLSLSAEEDLKRRFGGNIRSALGPGTVIEGTFRFDSPVRIDGSLKGQVSSSSVLIVGEDACVEADIEVGSLIVLGTVDGTIEANELIELRGEGNLEGSIFTKRLVIGDGATFNGSCRIVR